MRLRPLHVCLVGPDGAGKTTLATKLSDELTTRGLMVRALQPRPSWFHTVKPSTFDYHDPHAEAPRGFLASIFQVLFKLPFFILRTVECCLSRDGVHIEERGWLDQAVDHRRYRLSERVVPLVRCLRSAAGRPKLTVVLTGDPSHIASRKQELTTQEVERQLAEWDRYFSQLSHAHALRIDTTQMTELDSLTTIADHVEQFELRSPVTKRRLRSA